MQAAARPTWRAELLWKTALWPSVCQCWAREMAHSIKCLPCKHEDLILSLRTRENQLVQWSALACNPSIGKTGPRGSLGLTSLAHPATKTKVDSLLSSGLHTPPQLPSTHGMG